MRNPFGLSLSKPRVGHEPFDKLRAFDGLTMIGPSDRLRASGG